MATVMLVAATISSLKSLQDRVKTYAKSEMRDSNDRLIVDEKEDLNWDGNALSTSLLPSSLRLPSSS